MIFTELAPIDALSSGRVKLVSRLAVVDQPSSEFIAPCMAALRHGTVGRLSVPSGRGAAAEGTKYRSIGYGRLPVTRLNFAIASSTGGGGDSGPSLDAWHPPSTMPANASRERRCERPVPGLQHLTIPSVKAARNIAR